MESYSARLKLLWSFETPKVLAYAETRERRVAENKCITMRWTAIALVRRRPKKNEGAKFRISKASLCEQGKTWGCSLAKGGQTSLRAFDFSCRHRLVTSFLCQQSLTNWVTHKIILVLCWSFTIQQKTTRNSHSQWWSATSTSIDLASLISAAVDTNTRFLRCLRKQNPELCIDKIFWKADTWHAMCVGKSK